MLPPPAGPLRGRGPSGADKASRLLTGQTSRCIVCYMIRPGLCYGIIGNESFQPRVCYMTKKDIPRMIRELRKALGLTQEQFAAKVGVTFSTVNRWENSRGNPSPLAMRQIEELLKMLNGGQHSPTGDKA